MMTTRRLLATIAALLLALAACGGGGGDANGGDGGAGGDGGSALTGNVADGAVVYSSTCASCHGQDATGIDGLGKTLVGSEFVASSSEADLAAFIKVGRPSGDPANDTGIDMPAKGGNPSLDDQDLADVAAYVKSLN